MFEYCPQLSEKYFEIANGPRQDKIIIFLISQATMIEDGGRRTKDGGQRTEDGRQIAEEIYSRINLY